MEDVPPIKARFFYASPLAIDDALSPVPPPASSSSSTKLPPRPFSEYDNSRLDEAWHELRKNIARHEKEHGEERSPGAQISKPVPASSVVKGSSASKFRNASSPDHPQGSSLGSNASPRDHSWDPVRTPTRNERSNRHSLLSASSADEDVDDRKSLLATVGIDNILTAEAEPTTTTGTPFIRAPMRNEPRGIPESRGESTSRPRPRPFDSYKWDDARGAPLSKEADNTADKTPPGPSTKIPVGVSRLHHVSMPGMNLEPIYWVPVNDITPVVRATWHYKETMTPVEVPVANMLELGFIEMQAWTQTWQDELNSAVEVGAVGEEKICRKLWPDNLKKPQGASRPSTAIGETANMVQSLTDLETETPERQHEKALEYAYNVIDAAFESAGIDNRASGTVTYGRYGPLRTYATAGVIYANGTEAYILKPNLRPSSYYGRRPLANYIRKGHKIGIPVVRGFDQAIWDKLYPEPKSAKSKKAYAGASTNQAGMSPDLRKRKDSGLGAAIAPKVTDLVLVIHGIGQKLSERMESFHFTHAMNGFRREVNVELGTDVVRAKLRPDAGGIMVLPVNWRHTLSFEEGGYRDESGDEDNKYGLQDITPESLPSVRNVISDVMLDIPYYLSHHQPKMISAVIREANRIYQLWCANNPGFAENGRVHIIAHSLGSVMALDILSNQPTDIPSHLANPDTVPSSTLQELTHFLFPTTNLFFAGSPTGFFLLLKRASLRPRLHMANSTADPDITSSSAVCGSQGDYGCLAVANVYNIINPYDPVSYRLNATVDANYARSLRAAWLPSATPGWFSSSSNEDSTLGWFGGSGNGGAISKGKKTSAVLPKNIISTAKSNPLASSAATNDETAALLPRLPSNVELETHNFTREEIAEKRMFGLNDNGQIDWMVKYGGGPLDIQYLTMLGAHSSYWLLKDFVRAVVVECGRSPGRAGTVATMRGKKGLRA